MQKSERDALIENDFGWLADIKVLNVNGRLMMGEGDMPFNVAAVLREKDFVKEWLMPFALGNDLGTNYFPTQKWYELSNRGTRAVLVVDDADKPVCLVRPLVSNNLTPRDFEMLKMVSKHIEQVQADTMRSTDPNATMGMARMVKENIQAKRLTITDLVEPGFYAKHGINPSAEKKVYYIKDNINRGEADIKDINRSREILYRIEKNEKVSVEELKFLEKLSKGEFIIDDKIKDAPTTAAERAKPENPLEC